MPLDKRSALLAYLSVQQGWVSRDQLAFLFWPNTDNHTARANLRQLFKRCRQLPSSEVLETTREQARWVVSSDVAAFKEALAKQDWFAALSLYQGHLLESFYLRDDAGGFEAWLELERDSLKVSWQEAAFRAAEALAQTDRSAEAAALLLQLWRLDDYDERFLQTYLRHAYAAGLTAVALAAFVVFKERLRKIYEIDVSPETAALVASIQQGALDVDDNVTLEPQQLGRSASPLVGRSEELEALRTMLADDACRMLALTGPGGVGKTRLALALAEAFAVQYEHGAYLVPLAGVNDANQVITAIAAALSFSFYGSAEPIMQLTNYLRAKQMLLIIDNLEHVLEAASTLSELQTEAPHLKILITSRQFPEVPGVWHHPVSGLAFAGRGSAAAQLFIQQVNEHQPQFTPSEDDEVAIQALSQLVEGLPLALELSAVWIREFSVQDILEQLRRDLGMLRREGEHPQGSMEAVFNHSWALLSPEQQSVLARLSVFRGGFLREAAKAVAGATPYLLLSLQHRSLITRDAGGRYTLHELLRQFSAAKLRQQGEHETILDKHLHYYQDFASEADAQQGGANSIPWRERLKAEYENCLTALEWGFDKRPTEAVLLVAHLAGYWQARGNLHDAETWVKRAIEQSTDAPTDVRAKLQLVHFYIVTGKGEFKEAERLEPDVLATCRQTGDPSYEAEFCNRLGWTATTRKQLGKAQHYLERGLSLAEQTQNGRVKNYLLLNMARLTAQQDDLGAAFHFQDACLAMARERQDLWLEMTSLSNLAWMHLIQEDYAQCVTFSQDALVLAKQLDDVGTLAIIQGNLGYATWQLGQRVEGEQLYREHVRLLYAYGNIPYFVDNAFELAQFWHQLGFIDDAVCLWGAAETLRIKLEHPVITADYDEIKARVLNAVEAPKRDALLAKGSSLSPPDLLHFIDHAARS